MKRRDLEELRKQQRDRQQRKRKLWLRYGLIALGVGAVLFWMLLGKRLFNAALVSDDCKRIEQNFSSLDRYSELMGEFNGKAARVAVSKQPIDTVNKERFAQIAGDVEAEYERLKVLPIKDQLLSQYYSQFIEGLKFDAKWIRNFITNPSIETLNLTNSDRQNRNAQFSAFPRIQGRCQGFSNEEHEQMARQELNEFLKKMREEDAKNKR
jgi:hypothetical protein